MQSQRHRHDVVVVGARAAGAATALLLARQGFDVVLLDRDAFPSDTVSTHQIARPGVVQLSRWGLLDAVLASGAPALRQIAFTTPEGSVTRTVKDSAGVDLLVAPRRYVLDTLVCEAATAAGADVRLGVTVEGVHLDDAGRAIGVFGRGPSGAPVDLAARYVVGADGLGSRVARAVGAEVIEDRGAPGAAQYAYFAGVPWRGIELIVADRALTGVFPTHHGEACVWICSPTEDARAARRGAASREDAFTAYLRRTAPELAARLRTGRRTSPVTGMLRMQNYLRRPTARAGRWSATPATTATRSPATGCPTRTGTPNCWRPRWMRPCRAASTRTPR
jgi:2-polyprenyl-6-methoxyphenol hydroxylase-like FAD-dependent oxidoreductase